MEQYKKEGKVLGETHSALLVKGSTVVGPTGLIIGKVKDVRISPKTFGFEGILVKKGFKKTYISKEYIKELNHDAVLLKEDPVGIMVGKRVVTYDGEDVGKVTAIERSGTTNQLKSLIVKRFLRKAKAVPTKNVKSVGTDTVILK